MPIASAGAAAAHAAGALVISPVAPFATAQPVQGGHFHDVRSEDFGDGVIQIDTKNAGGAKYFDNTGKTFWEDVVIFSAVGR